MILNSTYINLLKEIASSAKQTDFDKSRRAGVFRGAIAQLIWQFVRFNENYQQTYSRFQRGTLDEDHLCWLFGLSKAVDPKIIKMPPSVEFKNSPSLFVKPGDISKEQKMKFLDFASELVKMQMRNQNKHQKESPVIAIINPLKDSSTIVRDLEKELQIHWPASRRFAKSATQKGSSVDFDDLIKRIVCYVGNELNSRKAKDIDLCLAEILGKRWQRKSTIQAKEIKLRIQLFKKLSDSAPWTFFHQPIK